MIKLICGNNFSGRSYYLKQLTGLIDSEKRILTELKGGRVSLYLPPNPDLFFTGIFDCVKDELFRYQSLKVVNSHFLQYLEDLKFIRLFNKPLSELSGGEKCMLAILSAIFQNPRTLAIDCLLEQLDDNNRRLILDCLNDMNIHEIVCADNRFRSFNHHSIHRFSCANLEREELKLKFNGINSRCVKLDISDHSNIVKLVNVSFSYKDNFVFEKLNLEFHSGSIYHLKGRNGSGKSTLSKLLTGLLPINKQGNVILNNDCIDPYRYPGQYARYCFQQPDDQLFESTISEELNYTNSNTNKSIIEAFGLTSLIDEHPLDVPIPLRKRITLAAVLSMDCPVYILDEPNLYLDDDSLIELAKIITLFKSKGKIIIIISHSQNFMDLFQDRITINIDNYEEYIKETY